MSRNRPLAFGIETCNRSITEIDEDLTEAAAPATQGLHGTASGDD
jgi:hypothetical protein